ncbi:MAG: Gfo/Idh/MocA family oxidoreductase [Phycisphaerae bacterium]|nr:Gfo/Idh/MocA family oxidoreductase [Phycisphaerae bacterium]
MTIRSNRRRFLKTAAASGVGVLLLPRHTVIGFAANEKLDLALVGAGGQGASNAGNVASENVVAICDVDTPYAEKSFKQFDKAKPFVDFRKMLDKMDKAIDAVVVSTPDHTHAVIAVAAMKRGKHVYCEKPLTRTVGEARVMRETAAKYKVVTQMGNQGSASEGLRRAVELATGGAVGTIQEAHVWFNGGNGPRNRPKDKPPVPAGLDWDLWLGPAPVRPYHPQYVRGKWRDWRAFGTGTMGDFWCHTVNLAFRGLQLGLLWQPAPGTSAGVIRVEGEASEINPETYPKWAKARYQFPARGNLPPAKMTWYNGGPRPPGEALPEHAVTEHGCALVGAKGTVFSDCPWNTRYKLLPEKRYAGFKGPPKTLPRSPGHHAEWIKACKGGPGTFSPFDIGGPLTEIALLGGITLLVGEPIEYDPVAGKIVNSPKADALLHREYRPEWTL